MKASCVTLPITWWRSRVLTKASNVPCDWGERTIVVCGAKPTSQTIADATGHQQVCHDNPPRRGLPGVISADSRGKRSARMFQRPASAGTPTPGRAGRGRWAPEHDPPSERSLDLAIGRTSGMASATAESPTAGTAEVPSRAIRKGLHQTSLAKGPSWPTSRRLCRQTDS